MKLSDGSKFSIRRLGDLEWWCDLIEYEGPLLSLYHVENRRLYLSMWVDRAGSGSRWLLFNVSDSDLRGYLGKRKSLRELLTESPLILTFVQNSRGRRSIRKIDLDLVGDYLPETDSYFDPRFATQAARVLAAEVFAEYNIHIAGSWFLDDWSEAPRLYRQIYAFNHALNNLQKRPVLQRVSGGLTHRPFTGGASVVGLLSDMQDAIPPISRVKVEAISYHSPGYISLRADPGITAGVETVMSIVNSPDGREALRGAYKALNEYLDDLGLRKLENASFTPQKYTDFEEVDLELKDFAATLMTLLGQESTIGPLLKASNSLSVVKALNAYVRRLFRLQSFVDEGLITRFGGPRK